MSCSTNAGSRHKGAVKQLTRLLESGLIHQLLRSDLRAEAELHHRGGPFLLPGLAEVLRSLPRLAPVFGHHLPAALRGDRRTPLQPLLRQPSQLQQLVLGFSRWQRRPAQMHLGTGNPGASGHHR